MPEVCFEIENAGGMKLSWKKKKGSVRYHVAHVPLPIYTVDNIPL